MFSKEFIELIVSAIGETFYMTVVSAVMAYVLGLPMGVLLVVTSKNGIAPHKTFNSVFGTLINILRSPPFIILLVAVIPITRFIVGTAVGSTATIVPLVIAAAPFVARMVESALTEVDRGVIEAAQSMGATPLRIITRVMLPEAMPPLITGAAITVTTILGYSTMAGFVGGGGLGAVAINYGYQRGQTDIMLVMLLLLIIIVQIFQKIGDTAAKKLDKRIR